MSKYKELAFEHIPSHKAFNFTCAKSIEGDEFLKLIINENIMPWEMDGLKYVPKQRGMGIYSLCQNCNNLTANYYGNEYIRFAYTVNKLFPNIEKQLKNSDSNVIGIHIKGIKPLLFAKQVLSMFCSICGHITKSDPYIKSLLLNKNQPGLDNKKYRLSMFLMNQSRIGYIRFQAMHIQGIGIIQVATIDADPFGFVLEFNARQDIKRSELDIASLFQRL